MKRMRCQKWQTTSWINGHFKYAPFRAIKKIFFWSPGRDNERKLLICWLIGLIHQWQNVRMAKCVYVHIPWTHPAGDIRRLGLVEQCYARVNMHVNLVCLRDMRVKFQVELNLTCGQRLVLIFTRTRFAH